MRSRPQFTDRENTMTSSARAPAVAGSFYPRDPDCLADTVDALLSAAAQAGPTAPKAIIVPHAGYVYSGPIAASAYAAVAVARGLIRRVVLLGPAHRVAVRGLALPDTDAFSTPLGEIPIDQALVAKIRSLPQICVDARCHAPEHSLEVQLPFLQRALGEFSLLPLVVGDATPAEVADVLRAVWGGPETLIVISSDLSHYLPYPEARRSDRATVDHILHGESTLMPDQACGATPVNGLLEALRGSGLAPSVIDLRNSGDTAGDRDRVVGYVAITFSAAAAVAADPGPQLPALARAAIAASLGLDAHWPAAHAGLEAPGAVFVTLTLDGELRGCIGSLEAYRSLREDTCANAVAAAQRDPRFAPLSVAGFAHVRIEVSCLSAPESFAARTEGQAWAAVRPGIDGVTLQWHGHRATFLPQVWAQLPTPREFFAHLKRKAGLDELFWADDVALARYTVQKWEES